MGQNIIFTLLFISSPNVDGFYIFMFHKVVWRRIVKVWWYIWKPRYYKFSAECAARTSNENLTITH